MGFLKNSSLYVIISMLKKAMPLIMIRFLTEKLPITDMGNLELFNVLNNFVGILISLSLTAYLMRIFYEEKKYKIAQLVSGSFVIQFLAAFVVFGILVGSRYLFGNLTKLSPFYDILIPFGAFISLIPTTSLYILRNEEKVKQFGVFVIASTAVEFLLSYYLLYETELSWESRVYSVLFTNMLFFVAHLIYLKKLKYLTLSLDLDLIKRAVKHCLPFVPGGLALFFLDMSDRYVIEFFLGKGILGIYGTGYRFGSIILVLANALSMAFIPMMYKLMAKKNLDKILFVQFLLLYQLVIFCLTIISYYGVEFLYYINLVQNEEYKSSIIFVPIISLAYLFFAFQQISAQLLNKTTHVKVLPVISIIGCLVNLGLNIWLLPVYGIMVACYSTLISFFIMWVLTFYYANKYYPLPWFNKSILKVDFKAIKDML